MWRCGSIRARRTAEVLSQAVSFDLRHPYPAMIFMHRQIAVPTALRPTEMHEDEARDSRKPVAPAIFAPVFLSNPNSVFTGTVIWPAG